MRVFLPYLKASVISRCAVLKAVIHRLRHRGSTEEARGDINSSSDSSGDICRWDCHMAEDCVNHDGLATTVCHRCAVWSDELLTFVGSEASGRQLPGLRVSFFL